MFVATTQQLFGAEDLHVVLKNFGLLLIGAMLAFLLEISEYLLVSYTSGLTLCIAGIFKVSTSSQTGVRPFNCMLPTFNVAKDLESPQIAKKDSLFGHQGAKTENTKSAVTPELMAGSSSGSN
jgi:hypothetical protein